MFILSWPRYLRLTNSIPVQTRAPCTCYRGSSAYKRAPGLENAMEIGKQWWIVSRLYFGNGPGGLKSASSPQCCSRQLDPRFCSSTSWFSGQPRPPSQKEQNMAFVWILAVSWYIPHLYYLLFPKTNPMQDRRVAGYVFKLSIIFNQENCEGKTFRELLVV